jgi:hypothetical protein
MKEQLQLTATDGKLADRNEYAVFCFVRCIREEVGMFAHCTRHFTIANTNQCSKGRVMKGC